MCSLTCRPMKEFPDRQAYYDQLQVPIQSGQIEIYVLLSEMKKPLGRVVMFDFNSRNHSVEFGYYLPPEHRGKKLGSRMIELFLENVFNVDSGLNKAYATTASNNIGSIKLLQGLGFELDGSLREHYWIADFRYDQLNFSMLRADWKQKQAQHV